MAKRKINEDKKITDKIEAKVTEVVEVVKAEATEDVATFTIDKWHVLLAAIVVIVVGLVIFL
jgi:hypothetical protein